jgi:hypothetical protein
MGEITMSYNFEMETELEFPVIIKAYITKYYPQTRHSPAEPEDIESIELTIAGCKLSDELHEKLLEGRTDMFESLIWEEVENQRGDIDIPDRGR